MGASLRRVILGAVMADFVPIEATASDRALYERYKDNVRQSTNYSQSIDLLSQNVKTADDFAQNHSISVPGLLLWSHWQADKADLDKQLALSQRIVEGLESHKLAMVRTQNDFDVTLPASATADEKALYTLGAIPILVAIGVVVVAVGAVAYSVWMTTKYVSLRRKYKDLLDTSDRLFTDPPAAVKSAWEASKKTKEWDEIEQTSDNFWADIGSKLKMGLGVGVAIAIALFAYSFTRGR